MPYIKDKRDDIDMLVNYFLDVCGGEGYTGYLNYFLFKLCKEVTKKPRYKKYRDFLGELEAAKLEIYRRQVAVYENEAINKNGDVK